MVACQRLPLLSSRRVITHLQLKFLLGELSFELFDVLSSRPALGALSESM